MENFKLLDKSELQSIDIKEFAVSLPDLKNSVDSKSVTISQWLQEKIEAGISSGKIEPNQLLPLKPEFAYVLGVSVGTVQNAIRNLEDKGIVYSKQCIGTLIADSNSKAFVARKLTSKRDIAVENIKSLIKKNKFKTGAQLPSTRVLANIIGTSVNTTRLALDKLVSDDIIKFSNKSPMDNGWSVKTLDFEMNEFEQETLVEKIENDLSKFITLNLKVGDRMPSHTELANLLKVSVKTVHDGLKTLIDKGVLLSRRGRYGTSVVRMPDETAFSPCKETSIFASAQETAFYHYERIQNVIKTMIAEKYEIGDKLPSIMDLSREMDLSPNTIRKAFSNLSKEGYLNFTRGRYGGTFVIDIPEMASNQAFKWLAVNPNYSKVLEMAAGDN